ncbi:Hypothetical protein MUW33_2787 [Mycobacterium canetti]|uniref:hypothetical protein n=1 Tax=Mycobacterium canetti TaxID=78331 RepID=UPI002D7A10F9|nr:hypothetical protein [Mycobacterium canetti]WRO42737.1 Hypothetical protein MUW33_2787 [Mycobacterium canetti]
MPGPQRVGDPRGWLVFEWLEPDLQRAEDATQHRDFWLRDAVIDSTLRAQGVRREYAFDEHHGRKVWAFTRPPTAAERTLLEHLGHVLPDEQQTVTLIGSPDGGTFVLVFDGQPTGPVAFDATTATLQAALEALPNIGIGDVTVTGAAGGPWTVTFIGALRGMDVPQLSAEWSGLTGGSFPRVNIATTSKGLRTRVQHITETLRRRTWPQLETT